MLAGAGATGWITAADEAGVSLDRGKACGYYPADYTFAPCPQVESLADGEGIDLGGGVVLRAVVTPGHADGHLCYHLRTPDHQALFSGDRVSPGDASPCRTCTAAGSPSTPPV